MHLYLTKNSTNLLKLISALIVMFHHYAQYVCSNNLSDSILYRLLSYQGGYVGVAIFFFLSGYGLMESESKHHLGALAFINRRLLKVYLPVLAVTFIWFIVWPMFLSSSPFDSSKSLRLSGFPFLGELTWGGGNGLSFNNIFIDFGDNVLWFINVLIVLYIIFYIFTCIFQKNNIAGVIFLWLLSFATIFLISHVMTHRAAMSAIYFTLGVQTSLMRSSSRQITLTLGILAILTLSGIIIFEKSLAEHIIINSMGIASILVLFSTKRIDFKFPTILGIITFDIYLVHHKVLLALKENIATVGLLLFIGVCTFTTILFYLLRTKLLRIK